MLEFTTRFHSARLPSVPTVDPTASDRVDLRRGCVRWSGNQSSRSCC